MHLDDLVEKSIDQLTTEELETRVKSLQSLTFRVTKSKSPVEGKSKSISKPKSNKDKQLTNALNGATPEQIAKIKELLGQ